MKTRTKKSKNLLVWAGRIFVALTFYYATANASGTWSAKTHMPTPRYSLGVAVAEGKIWAIGGANNTGKLSVVEMYDPISDSWSTKIPMTTPRSGLGVAVVDGKIYAIGGSSASHFLRAIERYDPVSNTWSTLAPMPKGRTEFAVAALGGKIYVFAGVASCLGDDGSGACDFADTRTFEYDPVTDSWTEKASSPIRIVQVAVAVGNKIYVAGGDSPAFYAYDPILDVFASKAPMVITRGTQPGHTALNGRVYIMGGAPSSGFFDSMEEYNPSTNTWSFMESMPTHRAGLGAAGANGKIFAIGGGNETGALAVNEEFAPDYLLFADERIVIKGQAASEGNIHCNGNIRFDKGNPSTHDGELTAVGNITIAVDNTILGDVAAGGSVKNSGNVVGTITEGSTAVISEPPPILSFSAGVTNVTVPNGSTQNLVPGSYGIVKAKKSATLKLANDGNSGDYYFKMLEVNQGGILNIDVSNGSVNIHVVNAIKFLKDVEVKISPDNNTEKVTFYSLTNATISIGVAARIFGNIVAPNAQVLISKGSGFKGAICANTIIVNEDATFLDHHSVVSLSKASGLTVENNKGYEVETGSVPKEFELGQNYPNPFNPSTTISFALPESGEIKLSIFNLKGQLVKTLASGQMAAGWHTVIWNGTNEQGNQAASGIYVYSLEAKGFKVTKKLVLAK